MSIPSTEQQRITYGEALLEKLLKQLPPKAFRAYVQPRIINHERATHPDFVVVARDFGVFVIEVKDWYSILRADQHQVVIRQRDGEELALPNPVITARNYALDLHECFEQRGELLENYRGRQTVKFPWHYVVALPNIPHEMVRQLEGSVWEQGVVWGREVFQNAKILYQAIQHIPWKWRLKEPLDKDTVNVIRGVIDPTVIVHDGYGNDIGELTPLQEALVQEPLPSAEPQQLEIFAEEAAAPVPEHTVRLVRGVAGSGKTLVLLQRARYLRERYPDACLLVLAFNKDIATNLAGHLPEMEVETFHRVCSRVFGKGQWTQPVDAEKWLKRHARPRLDEAGMTIDFMVEEFKWRKEVELFDAEAYLSASRRGRGTALPADRRTVVNQLFAEYIQYQRDNDTLDWEDVPLRAAAELARPDHPLRHHYDIILIDEAQDFAPSWLKVVKLLLKPDGSVLVCDDPTQSIFRFFSWREKGLEVVGRTKILRVPFRNSRQIARAAFSLIAADPSLTNNDEITPPDIAAPELLDGPDPLLLQFETIEDEVAGIVQYVNEYTEQGIPGEQIAILCHKPGLVKHWEDLRESGVYVDSFYRMKGLEFRAVLVPHLDSVLAAAESEADVTHVRQRLFTAMTRARELLLLSYQDELPAALSPLLSYVVRPSG